MAPSFITFSGNEDLGSGLKAVFKVENGLGMNSDNLLATQSTTAWNDGSSNNREAWVGLGGEFGEVKLGNQYTPIFWPVLLIDPALLNNAPGVLAAGQVTFTHKNATTYTSPTISGLTLSAQTQSGTADSSVGEQGSGFGYSLTYGAGPLYAAVAYNSTKITAATRLSGGVTTLETVNNYKTAATGSAGDSKTETVVGVSYDFGMAKVGYLSTRSDLNSYSTTSNMGAVTVPYGAASFAYTFSSGSVNGASTINQNGQQLNITYNFSKRTNAYLAYGIGKDTTNNDSYTMSGIGIAHSF